MKLKNIGFQMSKERYMQENVQAFNICSALFCGENYWEDWNHKSLVLVLRVITNATTLNQNTIQMW